MNHCNKFSVSPPNSLSIIYCTNHHHSSLAHPIILPFLTNTFKISFRVQMKNFIEQVIANFGNSYACCGWKWWQFIVATRLCWLPIKHYKQNPARLWISYCDETILNKYQQRQTQLYFMFIMSSTN